MRIVHLWRNFKQLKCGGRGYASDVIYVTKPGELAAPPVLIPASTYVMRSSRKLILPLASSTSKCENWFARML
jgi:hypothetical protein